VPVIVRDFQMICNFNSIEFPNHIAFYATLFWLKLPKVMGVK